MKVRMIKPHLVYKGEVDVDEERGNYLVAMKVAEKIEVQPTKEKNNNPRPLKEKKINPRV
jgi:hypothetical protein